TSQGGSSPGSVMSGFEARTVSRAYDSARRSVLFNLGPGAPASSCALSSTEYANQRSNHTRFRVMKPRRHDDSRGFLSEVYSRKKLIASGIDIKFAQDNHSLCTAVGTVRGLNYQIAPMAQAKLVRVVRGAIFDVAVDLRQHSSSC